METGNICEQSLNYSEVLSSQCTSVSTYNWSNQCVRCFPSLLAWNILEKNETVIPLRRRRLIAEHSFYLFMVRGGVWCEDCSCHHGLHNCPLVREALNNWLIMRYIGQNKFQNFSGNEKIIFWYSLQGWSQQMKTLISYYCHQCCHTYTKKFIIIMGSVFKL